MNNKPVNPELSAADPDDTQIAIDRLESEAPTHELPQDDGDKKKAATPTDGYPRKKL